MASPGFLNRLREHLAGEEFEERINAFMRKNAAEVVRQCAESKEGGEGTTEYSLESHGIWQDYLAVIESHMQVFQRDEKLSDYEFKLVGYLLT